MKSNLLKTLVRIALMNALTCILFFSTSFANPASAQQQTDLVTLTVTSSCASANVRLSTGEILKTPFNRQFPRGQSVTLEALDSSVPYCGALQVLTNFRRFIVNSDLMPKGLSSIELSLEKDTAVFMNYGFNDANLVTLSVWSSCPSTKTNVRVSENSIGGQSGDFKAHFDASFIQGQSVKLEADHTLAYCGDLGAAYPFRRWTAGGKIFPEGQIVIDLTLDQSTMAIAHYGYLTPSSRLNSFQLLRNGIPVDYIREDDKLKKYTVVLNADNFPQDTKVFVNGAETEIIRSSATQLEVKLLGKRAKTSGIILVVAIAPEDQYFTPAAIEVRRE